MARTSFEAYRHLLGAPGDPVEWSDRYILADAPIGDADPTDGMLDWGRYDELVHDLTPPNELLPAGTTPFDAPYVYRSQSLTFNIASYARMLLTDFFAAGGQFQQREFHSPADLATLAEPVVINCTGYGARALWQDESLVPVRGQIAWLTAQPDVRYGVYYKDVSLLSPPRRAGRPGHGGRRHERLWRHRRAARPRGVRGGHRHHRRSLLALRHAPAGWQRLDRSYQRIPSPIRRLRGRTGTVCSRKPKVSGLPMANLLARSLARLSRLTSLRDCASAMWRPPRGSNSRPG